MNLEESARNSNIFGQPNVRIALFKIKKDSYVLFEEPTTLIFYVNELWYSAIDIKPASFLIHLNPTTEGKLVLKK